MAKVLVPDQFPKGLRILVVDDDVVCLKVLAQMLEKCSYKVTCRVQATSALDLLRAKKGCFDLVLCDVYMPDMDGFKLLEHIGLEMDLPVIMISGDGSTSTVLKGIRHGACDFLVKPVREEELKNLWQHVVRRMRNGNKEHGNSGSFDDNDDNSIRPKRGCDDSGCASSVSEGSDGATKSRTKKKKDADEDDEDGDDNDLENEDPTASKKPRVVWSIELHQQFVNAVNHLGIDKAVPKRILELMNVPGLSRENVASHLQKFRLYLKRLSGVEQQHHTMIPSSLRGPVNQTRRLCSLQRFGIPSLAESSQIPSETLSMIQADLLGQPIDRLPLLQATLQGPPKCTTSNGARSGFAWTSNILPPQQQQIHKLSTVPDPGPSINVQPSCVVIPSQLGTNPRLISHNQGFNARSVENYSLAKSQLKSVVNGFFGFGTDSPSASSYSVNANTVPQVGNAVPLQMPAQHSVINSFPLSGNGTGMKSIPSRFAVDDIEFPIYDNITEVKHEPNVDLIDSSILGTSIFHQFPNDFTNVFSEQARIGPK